MDQVVIEAVEPCVLLLNKEYRREVNDFDYGEVVYFERVTDGFIAHLIEMDSDGDVELMTFNDISKGYSQERHFLVFAKANKPPQYIHDALNDILKRYQNPDRNAASELKWHKFTVVDRAI